MIYKQFLNDFFSELIEHVQDPRKIKMRVTLSVVLLISSILIYYILRKWPYKVTKDVKKNRMFFLITKYILVYISIFLLFIIWFRMFGALIISIISIGFILFLFIKGGVSNIAGGLVILNKQYFKLYDQIEIDGVKGIVLSVRPFYFVVMEIGNWFSEDTPTGRTIRIPNNTVLTHKTFNYNDMNPFIWKEIKYSLTSESHWKRAQKIMETIVDDYLKQFDEEYLSDPEYKQQLIEQLEIFDGNLLPKKIVNMAQNSIEIKIRFLVHYKEETTVITKLTEKVLDAFSKEADIKMVGKQIYIK